MSTPLTPSPVPPTTPPTPRRVETKVTVATVTTGLVGLGGAVLNAFVGSSALLGVLPAWAQFLIITLAPAIVTFSTAYAAPHTSP